MSTLETYPSLRFSSSTNSTAFEADQYEEPLKDSSPIWTVYAEAAKKADDLLIEEWNRGLDTLALFAGLFSAVTGAFIIESLSLMQPDYTELTFRVISANISGRAIIDEPFVISPLARAVNAVWIVSLLLSLSAALVALMGKDWIAAYPVPTLPNTREWAQLRQFRASSVQRWRMPEIIAFAPILLHVSLLLFAIGMVLFLYPTDLFCAYLIIGLTSAVALFYIVTTCSPFFFHSSPFRSPSTYAARGSTKALWDLMVSCILAVPTAASAFLKRIREVASGEHGVVIKNVPPSNYVPSIYSSESARASFLDSWTIVSSKAVGLPTALRSFFVSLSYRLLNWLSRDKSDRWHSVPSQPSSIQRSLADIVEWLATTSPTLEIFKAVLHVLKDAGLGDEVSSYLGSGAKTWFIDAVRLLQASHVDTIECARITVAGANLGLEYHDAISPFLFKCYGYNESGAEICPPDILMAFSVNSLPKSSHIRRAGRVESRVDSTVLVHVLNSISSHPGVSRDEQIELAITLLASFRYFFWTDHLATKMVKLLRPRAGDNLFISTLVYDANECQNHDPSCEFIDFLCAYVYHSAKFSLDQASVECALDTLVQLAYGHRSHGGHSSIAYLFAHSSSTDPIWSSRRWTNNDILFLLQCTRRSLIRDGIPNGIPIKCDADDDIARMISQFLSPNQTWVSSCYENRPDTGQFTELIKSFIPASGDTSSAEIRSRTYDLLDIALAEASLAVIEMDSYSLLLPLLATFLSEDPDPHQPQATSLFDRLMAESVTKHPEDTVSIVRRWDLADHLVQRITRPTSDIYASLVLETDRELLHALSILLHRYPKHDSWKHIRSNLDTVISTNNGLSAERLAAYEEFQAQVKSVIAF